MRNLRSALLLPIAALALSGCGYNSFQKLDEDTNSAWAEVVNQYQRRSDLVPNLVNVVKAYAAHENETLVGIADARSKASSITLTPDVLRDSQAMKNFQQAQAGLGSALSRLVAVAEKYPELKADQGFRDLQSQLEGTENRIAVARNRYIKAVQSYNVLLRQFPSNLTAGMFGYQIKPQFSVENERAISTASRVDFDARK
jgi:LemA protein